MTKKRGITSLMSLCLFGRYVSGMSIIISDNSFITWAEALAIGNVIILIKSLYQFTKMSHIAIDRDKQLRLEQALKKNKGAGCVIPKLDPYLPERTKLDKDLPPIVCEGLDWVRCYVSFK